MQELFPFRFHARAEQPARAFRECVYVCARTYVQDIDYKCRLRA